MSGYRHDEAAGQPPYLHTDYGSTTLRPPSYPLVPIRHTLSEITGPVFGEADVSPGDSDLTRQHDGEPVGERITVSGRILDGNGEAIPNTLVELWQANAAGRYAHPQDDHNAPLDANFTGGGRALRMPMGSTTSPRSSRGPIPGRIT